MSQGLSRRGLLAAVGGVGAVAATSGLAGAVVGASLDDGRRAGAESAAVPLVPFHGPYQAGIATPVQDRLHLAAFDLTTTSRAELRDLLRSWTAAARAMCAGHEVGAGAIPTVAEAPPADTGEAIGLPPARLTLTVGFGGSLFDERFGLAAHRPAALVDLPAFAGDALQPERCGGDVVVQACSDDPQVAVHAIRNLARLGFGAAEVRWSQLGFGKTSSTTPHAATPRNLFGFKDGTANIAGEDAAALAEHVWVGPDDDAPARGGWLAGGCYLVARRIRMTIETWDRTSLAEQEAITGRHKGSGAPLGQAREHDTLDPATLPENAHVRLAHPSANGGARLLRRGYSFVDGSDGLGRLDAGLFFLSYQRDPRRSFIPMQEKLSRLDGLHEYLRHTGSGLWAVPPGVRDDRDYWGRTLLG